jgi:hypothetical protein
VDIHVVMGLIHLKDGFQLFFGNQNNILCAKELTVSGFSDQISSEQFK